MRVDPTAVMPTDDVGSLPDGAGSSGEDAFAQTFGAVLNEQAVREDAPRRTGEQSAAERGVEGSLEQTTIRKGAPDAGDITGQLGRLDGSPRSDARSGAAATADGMAPAGVARTGRGDGTPAATAPGSHTLEAGVPDFVPRETLVETGSRPTADTAAALPVSSRAAAANAAEDARAAGRDAPVDETDTRRGASADIARSAEGRSLTAMTTLTAMPASDLAARAAARTARGNAEGPAPAVRAARRGEAGVRDPRIERASRSLPDAGAAAFRELPSAEPTALPIDAASRGATQSMATPPAHSEPGAASLPTPPVSAAAVEATASNVPTSEAGRLPPQPVQALPQQIQLIASQGGGTARMQLSPPELGGLQIKVSLRGSAVDVVIRADEASAQTAVLGQRDQLADALGTRELRMETFDVLAGDRGGDDRESGAEQRADAFGFEGEARDGRRPTNRPDASSSAPDHDVTPPPAGIAAARAAGGGIDLRI